MPMLPFILMGVLLLASFQVSAKEVVDQLGRRVRVPEHPIRIVALAPSITEIVFALDAGDRLKGVTRFSNFPPQAENLPKVGSYVQLDLEKIMAIQPDLCIAVKDGNPKEIIERLDRLGVPVYAVDPRNLRALTETILEIGNLLDVMPRAKNLVQQMEKKTRTTTSKSPERLNAPPSSSRSELPPLSLRGPIHSFMNSSPLPEGSIWPKGPPLIRDSVGNRSFPCLRRFSSSPP